MINPRRPTPNDCPSEQELLAFSLGMLDDEQREFEISDHLESCPVCISILGYVGTKPDSVVKSIQNANDAPTPLDQGPIDPAMAEGLMKRVIGLFDQGEAATSEQKPPNPEQMKKGGHIGRYEIIDILGEGGFGTVYLAKDSQLTRKVAIKVPHAFRTKDPQSRQSYMREARTLAQLDHASIVPIYDYGTTADRRCFVVSKFIEGYDLRKAMEKDPRDFQQIANWIAQVASALAYIHSKQIVHRDIKPANLLVDQEGKIFVTDFGLAIRNESTSDTRSSSGTPSYMSPEQIRMEGHRVDGRSDQFSLGIVMYELLTGVKPFTGADVQEVFQNILSQDPVPPSERNPKVPSELNRICLKLLSKLASQRYAQTLELVTDLRDWLAEKVRTEREHVSRKLLNSTVEITDPVAPVSQEKYVPIVPRGLLSFSQVDAYFFLELLPGVRDRYGIPLSVAHWIRWLTESDEGMDTDRIGVLAGPTGCGKSSLIRAGILPRIEGSHELVLVEATSDHTERQIRAIIGQRYPQFRDQPLVRMLSSIRVSKSETHSKPMLIVLDQFEQWLFAQGEPVDTELVSALRQCDGVHLRCLLLIRDDFWLALHRFMEAVEVPIALGKNAQLVDLFDVRHARKVLLEFGRGFDRLPLAPQAPSAEQEKFLDEAIAMLTQGSKVVPVHLAIFAEMFKSKDWLPSTLKRLGGSAGIGAQFMSEAFSETYSPVHQRVHEPAVRRVLNGLLPDIDTKIKNKQLTYQELQELSGYEHDESLFHRLLNILESDLKIICAYDGMANDGTQVAKTQPSKRYQLSHDFLVPSIREWLTERQRATIRGRLLTRISEQASRWQARHDVRFLPSLFDWSMARFLIRSRDLSLLEKKYMRASDRRAITQLLQMAAVFLIAFFSVNYLQSRTRFQSLIEQLGTAEPASMSSIVEQISQRPRAAPQSLSSVELRPGITNEKKLIYQIARIRYAPELAEEVLQEVLTAENGDLVEFASRQLLYGEVAVLKNRCWDLIAKKDPAVEPELGWRVAQLLSQLDPPKTEEATEKWKSLIGTIAELQIQACMRHPDRYRSIAKSLENASALLLEPLAQYLGILESDDAHARFATSLLSDYTHSDPATRTRFALDASDWQRALLMPSKADWSLTILQEVSNAPLEGRSPNERLRSAHRRAVATAILLAASSEKKPDSGLWEHFRRSEDPTERTKLIPLLALTGVPAEKVIERLIGEKDPGILAALLISLGDYPKRTSFPFAEVQQHVSNVYRNHSDGGVHSAAEWLLRQWGESTINLASSVAANNQESPERDWYVGPNGRTFVRVRGSADAKIHRDLFVSTTETTFEQFKAFDASKYMSTKYSPFLDCPACVIGWKDAVKYCNWLSEREGLPPFYPTDSQVLDQWVPTEEDLAGIGYRLPNDAEWEFACRAGTTTDRYFGSDPMMLNRYDWTEGSREEVRARMRSRIDPGSRPNTTSKQVGRLRPNDHGIFDLYGNVSEWCNDLGPSNPNQRAFRGGAASSYDFVANSHLKASELPNIQYDSFGFRVVRTARDRK